ncbi:hypothetical protein NPIL_407591 [Nephila pilipes]|uniref:Uncharacterized protein n=1 Tax=Nephila pilipes TaxID=299642 RepID=A0A8X6PB52_NEPPI|nr:hypothetical protein NPIL_407591 [Nephila pilipes]
MPIVIVQPHTNNQACLSTIQATKKRKNCACKLLVTFDIVIGLFCLFSPYKLAPYTKNSTCLTYRNYTQNSTWLIDL